MPRHLPPVNNSQCRGGANGQTLGILRLAVYTTPSQTADNSQYHHCCYRFTCHNLRAYSVQSRTPVPAHYTVVSATEPSLPARDSIGLPSGPKPRRTCIPSICNTPTYPLAVPAALVGHLGELRPAIRLPAFINHFLHSSFRSTAYLETSFFCSAGWSSFDCYYLLGSDQCDPSTGSK